MAELTDLDSNTPEAPEAPETEQVETLDTEALTAHLEEALDNPQEPEEPTASDDLPEKYRGKTIKEVVAMHQSAEKRMGQQGSEVGELRSIVDDFIRGQQANQAPVAPEPEEEEVSFFEDPDAAVERAISKHPEVVRARQASENYTRQTAAATLHQRHPDAAKVINDPGFAEFVKGSPIRKELFARADAQSDVDAADELLTQYKARKGAATEAATADKASRSAQLKQANTGAARGTSATQGKRIYKRSDIVALMRDKPDVYQRHADDIQLAYQEGRVK